MRPEPHRVLRSLHVVRRRIAGQDSTAMAYVRGSVTVTTTVEAAGMIAVADGA